MTTDARLWHPWLRINRVLRLMLHTRWNAEAWSVVRVEFRRGASAQERDPWRGSFNQEAPEAARPNPPPTDITTRVL